MMSELLPPTLVKTDVSLSMLALKCVARETRPLSGAQCLSVSSVALYAEISVKAGRKMVRTGGEPMAVVNFEEGRCRGTTPESRVKNQQWFPMCLVSAARARARRITQHHAERRVGIKGILCIAELRRRKRGKKKGELPFAAEFASC